MAGVIVNTHNIHEVTQTQERLREILGSKKFNLIVNQVLLEESEPYVFKKSGALRKSGKARADGISYSTEYARYLYYDNVYAPNWMVYTHDPVTGKINGKLGWLSPPGEGSKHPTGRPFRRTKKKFIDRYGIDWTLGPSTKGTRPEWVRYAYQKKHKRINQIITNRLKKELE